jgi:hypothetical protein
MDETKRSIGGTQVKKRKAKSRAPQESPRWGLGYLEVAEKEARKLLTDDQYDHVLRLFDDLACEVDPTKSETLDIGAIEDFYELKDKGGILGKINLRAYFVVVGNKRLIVVLMVYKKEEEHQTPEHVKACVRNRLREVRKQL